MLEVEDPLERLHFAIQSGCSGLGAARRGVVEPTSSVRIDVLQREGEGSMRTVGAEASFYPSGKTEAPVLAEPD